MAISSILRNHAYLTQTIAINTAVSDAFDFRPYTMGLVYMPAAWTTANIGFYVCPTLAGTYVPLYDKNGSLVEIASPAVDCAFTFPAELAGAHFVKLWSQDGAASDTNQAAARSLIVHLKS